MQFLNINSLRGSERKSNFLQNFKSFKAYKGIFAGFFLGSTMLLAGCASTPRNVALQDSFWQNPQQKITVATIKNPAPKIHVVGNQGIMDMAITSVVNRHLDKAIRETDLSWYSDVPNNFAQRLKQSKMHASVYSKPLEKNKKTHANVLAETNSDLLLTFELKAIGARRLYKAGFIPTNAPEGYCVLVGELVDPLNKSKVLWRHETEIIQKVVGKWDEPPHFSNFKNALNVAVAEAKQEIMDSFFSGR